MRAQDLNRVQIGARIWIDNLLCDRGQGFKTVTTRLYPTVDETLPAGYVAYTSPYKSWVCDSGVDNAVIPNSISGAFGTINRGTSGMNVDFDNGRVLLTGVSRNLNITGTYSFKEFNIYSTNSNVEDLIIESKNFINPKYRNLNTGIAPYDVVTPCVFINVGNAKNSPRAFGGLKDSKYTISMIVFADNDWQLNAAMGLITDTSEKYFPAMSPALDPIGPLGTLKSGFDYSIIQSTAPQSDYVFVDSVFSSKISDKNEVNESLFVGIVEMDAIMTRTT